MIDAEFDKRVKEALAYVESMKEHPSAVTPERREETMEVLALCTRLWRVQSRPVEVTDDKR